MQRKTSIREAEASIVFEIQAEPVAQEDPKKDKNRPKPEKPKPEKPKRENDKGSQRVKRPK